MGNEVVKGLVLSGFLDITLVDMDHVVMSNLNRCVLLRPEDAGNSRAKAPAVAERANRLVGRDAVHPMVTRVEEFDGWNSMDLVLGCLDNIGARLHVNARCCLAGIPYVDGGTDGMRGKVQVIVDEGPCLQCTTNRSHYAVLERRYSCTGSATTLYRPHMAAEITTTSVVAAVQVREALKLVSGMQIACIRHVMYYDGMAGTCEILEASINPGCPNHYTCSPSH